MAGRRTLVCCARALFMFSVRLDRTHPAVKLRSPQIASGEFLHRSMRRGKRFASRRFEQHCNLTRKTNGSVEGTSSITPQSQFAVFKNLKIGVPPRVTHFTFAHAWIGLETSGLMVSLPTFIRALRIEPHVTRSNFKTTRVPTRQQSRLCPQFELLGGL